MPDEPTDDPRSSVPFWPTATEDRRRAGPVITAVIALLLGVAFWSALGTLPVSGSGHVFIDAAVVTAVVAVVALRSVPLRWIVRSYAFVSALLLLRLGWLREASGVLAAQDVLVWVLATAGALALCPSPAARMRRPVTPSASPSSSSSGPGASSSSGSSSDGTVAAPLSGRAWPWPAAIRAAVGAVALVAAISMVLGPVAGDRSPAAPSGGDSPDQFDRGADNAMTIQEQLDTTTRPRLTDAIVMVVRSDIETFWRTTTYDRWDGSVWTRSDGGAVRPVVRGQVEVSADDLAADVGEPSTQEFRLQGGFANALPVAPSVSSVDADGRIFQRPDGSLIAPGGVGSGATYRVESRQVPVTAERLAAIDEEVPSAILERYGQPAETTERVRALARQIAGGGGSQLAKIRALEAWMAGNLEYSLDAPLAPKGADVVDDFLFESKLGWCEQIASSLVVMLREVGVPARLATGFAPGEQDEASGRFIVRERDAHAWAEVWFPEVGWVPFDPTADVPFAGDAANGFELPIGFVGLAIVLLFVGAVVALAAPLARRLHAWRERRALRRAADRLAKERWDVQAERELEELGEEVGRPRAPSETVSAHARELAAVTGRPELADQGRAVDDYRYGPPSTGGS